MGHGKPVPFSTRRILRQTLDELHRLGYEYVCGLEVEFYITRLEDPMLAFEQSGWPPDPPRVSAIAHGFQYLTDNRNAEIDSILQMLRDNLQGIGLPLRSMEDEWGPGQSEFTFDPLPGMGSADAMILFRTATKQLCRQAGLHATFMSRPLLPNAFSSGWHLHQSLQHLNGGGSAFMNTAGPEPLSEIGRHFVGGLLAHAQAASVFSTPTINGYKRFRPNSFAPNKATWAYENRGAMIRVIGEPDDPASRIENRVGEPAANPYLYMASQIVCGMDGITHQLDPGPMTDDPYQADRPMLPRSLMEAVAALRQDSLFRQRFGDAFVDYILMVKDSEIGRYLGTVTDWEQREYFEVF